MRVLVYQGRDADIGRWADAGIEARDLPESRPAELARRAPANAVVVLGAPGAGKSVLLRHLQTETARPCLAIPSRHPVLRRAECVHGRRSRPADVVARALGQDGRAGQTFDAVRREGRLLLMADALNEVGHHGDLGARLDRWRDMLPAFVRDGNRAVFTCRTLDIGAV